MNRTPIYKYQFYLSWLASCFLLLSSIFLLVLAFYISPTDAQCIRHNFVWSPALDQIKYHWETFPDYNLFNESKYFALSPTTEIERLWEEVQLSHPISIPSDKLELLNQSYHADDEDWIRDPEDSNAILAIPEYAAQLGCLNFLRQWTFSPYRDYTYLASHQGGNETLWKRSHQCLERLRQAFMVCCSG
ncbi:hypothetical protein LSUE1_G008771 [Lachnellula suecica]|uniref:Uncharacterized protein n=1 Tax=Lachnellula suecica TaxID=602035 RepID=A0A8T9BZW5_9HELO|nr:hypothetical protein LSUE1_G008771 [Lachnellula suecica]